MPFTRSSIGAVAGILAALAFAAPAVGATSIDRIKGTCVTGGQTKLNPPSPYTGGTGTYEYFPLVFACVTVEISKGTSVAVSLLRLEVVSSGTYTNVVCGTLKLASGSAYVYSAVNSAIIGWPKAHGAALWTTIVQDLDYTIEFVAGQGLLKWTAPAGQKLSPDLPKVLTAGPGGFPGGFVSIQPDNTKSQITPEYCTKAFVVQGVLVFDWAPGNPIV